MAQTTYRFPNGLSLVTDTDTGNAAIAIIEESGVSITVVEPGDAVRFALAILTASTPIDAVSEHGPDRFRFYVGEGAAGSTAVTPLEEGAVAWHLNHAVASLAAISHYQTKLESAAGQTLDEQALDFARAHAGNEELTLLDLADHEVESWRDVARYAQSLPSALKV